MPVLSAIIEKLEARKERDDCKMYTLDKVRRIRCGSGNCFLLIRADRAVLVDTARTSSRQLILDACKPYDVRLIVLTHGHMDHVQNAAFLSRALNCPIAMHASDVELLEDNERQALSAQSLLGKIIRAVSLKSFRRDTIEAFTPSVLLDEGDSLEEYGFDATVLALPGHTKGSIGLDLGEQGILVGDALMNMVYPTVSMLYYDRALMLDSARRISALGPRLIHFGHGKSVPNRNWA